MSIEDFLKYCTALVLIETENAMVAFAEEDCKTEKNLKDRSDFLCKILKSNLHRIRGYEAKLIVTGDTPISSCGESGVSPQNSIDKEGVSECAHRRRTIFCK